MARTVQDILDERAGSLVGRDRELSELMRLAGGDGPLVAYVHGVAGVGKSTLLRAFASRARSAGVHLVQLDGAAIEPTERGLLVALAENLERPIGSVEEAVAELAEADGRTLIVIDTVERLLLLDDWLRRELLPALPENARMVLAGREAPAPAWAGDLGELMTTIALGGLSPADAEELLRRAAVPEDDVERVNRLAHGHPLSLRLAASALRSRGDLTVEELAIPALVEELTRVYLAGLDADTRRALDAGAVVRRPTRSVLAAMLAADGDDAWRRLDRLPFTEIGPDGLVLHDTVREAIDAGLRATDPDRRRRLRSAAFAQLQSEARDAAPTELWRYTSDLLFLADNPIVRDGFFPVGGPSYTMEAARGADAASVIGIAERHGGPEVEELVTAWWQALPEAFRVARDRSGAVAAFLTVCEARAADTRVTARDPVAARWREDLRRRPLADGDAALFVRFALGREEGEAPGPEQAALWIDAKREYMALRPHLRRVFVVTTQLELLAQVLEPLGFRPLPAPPVTIGGRSFDSLTLDFGPRSVDGWLAGLVATELGVDPGPRLETERRELVIAGSAIGLTPLESEFLAYLRARAGRPVARAELLRHVWGHESASDGNVIEAAVSAIRRKLGEHAGLVETVRGVGYRWREP